MDTFTKKAYPSSLCRNFIIGFFSGAAIMLNASTFTQNGNLAKNSRACFVKYAGKGSNVQNPYGSSLQEVEKDMSCKAIHVLPSSK